MLLPTGHHGPAHVALLPGGHQVAYRLGGLLVDHGGLRERPITATTASSWRCVTSTPKALVEQAAPLMPWRWRRRCWVISALPADDAYLPEVDAPCPSAPRTRPASGHDRAGRRRRRILIVAASATCMANRVGCTRLVTTRGGWLCHGGDQWFDRGDGGGGMVRQGVVRLLRALPENTCTGPRSSWPTAGG